MKAIQIVAFDLDGTLLDSDKNISERNIRALARCAEKESTSCPPPGGPRTACRSASGTAGRPVCDHHKRRGHCGS
ncbi:MAG: HAD family hydrolase [Intestinimonas butyriciproducens]|uniref:HAD family hydrolase n=1 Tax=Intestinimonas butyriciproducens TaxID=1297617 RepID=UPI0039942B36